MKDFLTKHSLKILITLVIFFIAIILLQNFRDDGRDFINRNEIIKNAHFYKSPAKSVAKIKLKVFYVVPTDKVNSIYGNFYLMTEKALKDIVRFHRFQFRQSSVLQYDIYPEPFFMKENSIFYNTENTNHGNPEGLRNIIPEIEETQKDFLKHKPDEFLIIGVIYEGVGASGAEGAFLLSRIFLSEEQYQPIASTLLYHEFGHSLGLPDQYDLKTGAPYSNDIMGGGREKPIETSYIDKELLKELGVRL